MPAVSAQNRHPLAECSDSGFGWGIGKEGNEPGEGPPRSAQHRISRAPGFADALDQPGLVVANRLDSAIGMGGRVLELVLRVAPRAPRNALIIAATYSARPWRWVSVSLAQPLSPERTSHSRPEIDEVDLPAWRISEAPTAANRTCRRSAARVGSPERRQRPLASGAEF